VCTLDTCVSRSCENTPVTDGTACDDGAFCTASDTCEAGVCEGTGSPCTATTTCNEETQTCDCTLDADCDDGVFCNGAETCDGTCQDGTPVDCPDDGAFCNGDESCDEEADECVSSGDPCAADEICIEEDNTCEPPIRIEATFSGCGTRFLFWFGAVLIEGTGTDFTPLGSIVRYDPPLIKGLKLTPDAETINQLVILLPSDLLFLPGFDFPFLPDYPLEVTVTVDGLSDTFVIPACVELEE
jgi:hypothetical protein